MDNKTLVRRWFEEVWNHGRKEAVDEMAAPDTIAHGLADTSGNQIRGASGIKMLLDIYRGAFPDLRIEVEDTISEGNKVVARCRVTGTHTGEGLGLPPTGRKVEFTGVTIAYIRDGKIVEGWNSYDFATMFQQIGAGNDPTL